MRRRVLTGICAAAAIAAALLLLLGGGGEDEATAKPEPVPGEPTIEIVSPRNGSRQENRAVVARVEIANFHLAPRHFGDPPQLGEGHIKFSLNRVPDCVDPVKLQRAINSPIGSGRLIGRSFDYGKYSGPNGVLAELIGSAGLYSPRDQAGDLLRAPPPGLLPVDHHPGAQRRDLDPLARRDQLRGAAGPAPARGSGKPPCPR